MGGSAYGAWGHRPRTLLISKFMNCFNYFPHIFFCSDFDEIEKKIIENIVEKLLSFRIFDKLFSEFFINFLRIFWKVFWSSRKQNRSKTKFFVEFWSFMGILQCVSTFLVFFSSTLKIIKTNKMKIMMHDSVQKEWIFNTKQLEVAKFHYKHFQWHSIEGAGNVLHVALTKPCPRQNI